MRALSDGPFPYSSPPTRRLVNKSKTETPHRDLPTGREKIRHQLEIIECCHFANWTVLCKNPPSLTRLSLSVDVTKELKWKNIYINIASILFICPFILHVVNSVIYGEIKDISHMSLAELLLDSSSSLKKGLTTTSLQPSFLSEIAGMQTSLVR